MTDFSTRHVRDPAGIQQLPDIRILYTKYLILKPDLNEKYSWLKNPIRPNPSIHIYTFVKWFFKLWILLVGIWSCSEYLGRHQRSGWNFRKRWGEGLRRRCNFFLTKKSLLVFVGVAWQDANWVQIRGFVLHCGPFLPCTLSTLSPSWPPLLSNWIPVSATAQIVHL